MMADVKLEKVQEIALRACESSGVDLYDIEYLKGAKTLRIYIDKDKEAGGIQLDDCATISEKISTELDPLDLFPNDYNLEVSSPGVERVLRQEWHFNKVKGKKIEIKLYQSLGAYFPDADKKLEKAKTFKCLLKEVKNDEVIIDLEGRDFLIPLKNITKANLVFEL
ncbi:MAG: ribosome maturation factor RimP [Bdellovibrionales bacterium]|nr:ribosome maturation factor RimP [Bdellovibrionales bacterium]